MQEEVQEFTPKQLLNSIPSTKSARKTVAKGRQEIGDILSGRDDRLLILTGPCSIHDMDAAREYRNKLLNLASRVEDKVLIVMRAYFEKPRTGPRWPGYATDPDLDRSGDLEKGLTNARQFLLDTNRLGLPVATEMLNPLLVNYYIRDLISWGVIGARTVESPVHQQHASSLNCPVGFKNSTDGNIDIALNAIGSANRSHVFNGLDLDGRIAQIQSNPGKDFCGHLILRGGGGRTNYDQESVRRSVSKLGAIGVNNPRILVDCGHANSPKGYQQTIEVMKSVSARIKAGEKAIAGLMIESNLLAGTQKDNFDKEYASNPIDAKRNLVYGQSITDSCVSFEQLEEFVLSLVS